MPTTKKKPAEKTPAAAVDLAAVHIDHRNKRDDSDALTGHFCRITKGDHEGRVGVFESAASTGKDGWPDTINVNLGGIPVTVPYEDCVPDTGPAR